MAAAFDDALMETVADTISTEARAKYNMQSALGDRDIYKGLTVPGRPISTSSAIPGGAGGRRLTARTRTSPPVLASRSSGALQGKGDTIKVAACAKH